MKRSLVVAGLLSGCVPAIAPTNVVISRYEAGGDLPEAAGGRATLVSSPVGVRSCTLSFGWTLREVENNCGQPDAFLSNSNAADGLCLGYASIAATLGDGHGPAWIAVCLANRTRMEVGADGKRKDVTTLVVSQVYGLSAPPPGLQRQGPAPIAVQPKAD